ncbi:hypothetical protein GNX71_18535 [Variovorax sp. RKNM96]|uniref:hypothetical protein n=1 Tax=Variovorax sp. RKNM96 TaxID=2681552 RepID=UPI00197DBEBF|nr:hypothetical protein [Variovorax sp. RKNM96]QSI31467.1 hypothetical protein GNX71_18535 [Variovorax sp. RKNM96]
MGEVTEVAVATMDFFTAEVDDMHHACDRALVDRVAEDGSVLSIAQRVWLLSGAYVDSCRRPW